MTYSIRFYEDIVRYHETRPCQLHSRTYATMEEAEDMARQLLPEIRNKHGERTGYAVFDVIEGMNNAIAIGPRVHDDAQRP